MAKKYIDAELLKKEIEELEGLEYPCDNSEQNVGFENALDRVSDIIGSLQQEQPCDTCTNDKGCVACKDGELWEGKEQPFEELEKEVSRYIEDNFTLTDEVLEMPEEDRLYSMDKSDVLRLARHFYELGKQSKEPVTEGFEEAAEKEMPEEYGFLELDIYGGSETVYSREQMLSMFKSGAEWQNEQMLKDAVEGMVCKDHIVTEKPFYFYQSRLIELPDNLKEGELVKIIIIPEKED